MAGGGNVFKVEKGAWSSVTIRLLWICAIYSMGSIFFGYDGASFAGVQAFTPFARKFGTYNASSKTYALGPSLASIMNSVPLVGKFTGAVIVGPLTERFGHRYVMAFTCVVQIVGTILQVTTQTTAQFTAGRVLVYTAVGLVENVVPTYESEITPAPLRGFFVGSLQLFLTLGSLIAGIVNNACSGYTDDKGWQIATAMQIIPAGVILSGVFFTPNSPRWLISRGRSEEALAALRSLRTQREIDAGLPEQEIQAWLDMSETTQHKAPWLSLFRGANLRRTLIACTLMSWQQVTGVTFSSSYGPTFFKRVGLGSMAFTYAAINNAVSVVTALIGMILFDRFGRRSVCFWGSWGQALFLILVGVLGSKASPTKTEQNTMVASFILYAAILHCSIGPGAYITSAEVGTASLREKTMSLSTAVNVIVGFAVVYSSPYLIAAIAAQTAYIWGSCAAAAAIWVWFCLPEMKGRTLEELDEIFDAKIPAWRFAKYETSGLSHDIAEVQKDPKHVEKYIAKPREDVAVEEKSDFQHV